MVWICVSFLKILTSVPRLAMGANKYALTWREDLSAAAMRASFFSKTRRLVKTSTSVVIRRLASKSVKICLGTLGVTVL